MIYHNNNSLVNCISATSIKPILIAPLLYTQNILYIIHIRRYPNFGCNIWHMRGEALARKKYVIIGSLQHFCK